MAAAPVVMFVGETRLVRTREGRFYSPDGAGGDALWEDYARVIEDLRFAARVKDVDTVPSVPPLTLASVVPIRHYEGARGLVGTLPAVAGDLWRAVSVADVVVIRAPGFLGYISAAMATIQRRPLATEVHGDPFDVLLALNGKTLRGRAAALAAGGTLRVIAKASSAMMYVTAHTLQGRYPARATVPSVQVSSVLLEEEAFCERKEKKSPSGQVRMICMGSQNTSYKGHDVAIQAVKSLRDAGMDATLAILGTGKLHADYVALAESLGVAEFVDFKGHVSERSAIWNALDQADVYLHPSRTEGLPRAIIEAQARGLPVVATDVGGIPELTAPIYTVPVDDVPAIVRAVQSLATDGEAYSDEAERSTRLARTFDRPARRSKYQAWSRIIIDLARAVA